MPLPDLGCGCGVVWGALVKLTSTPATPTPSSFVYAVCQRGAEKSLKDEVARDAPALRPAFMRPGFVTFKVDGDVDDRVRVPDQAYELNLVFSDADGAAYDNNGGQDYTFAVDGGEGCCLFALLFLCFCLLLSLPNNQQNSHTYTPNNKQQNKKTQGVTWQEWQDGAEARAYRVWFAQVLQPLNEKAARIVVDRIDLLDSAAVVPELLQLVAHVFTMKVCDFR